MSPDSTSLQSVAGTNTINIINKDVDFTAARRTQNWRFDKPTINTEVERSLSRKRPKNQPIQGIRTNLGGDLHSEQSMFDKYLKRGAGGRVVFQA